MREGAFRAGLPWPPPWDVRAALELVAREGVDLALRVDWRPPHLAIVPRPLAETPRAPLLRVLAPGAVPVPVPVGTKSTRRAAYDAARAAARAGGAWDALVRAADGHAIEGTVANVFVARAGELVTPPLARGALPGTVRALLLRAAETGFEHGRHAGRWRVCEGEVGPEDLERAEEILLTNALVRVLGIARLDGEGLEARDDLPGPDGPLARSLRAFVRRVESA